MDFTVEFLDEATDYLFQVQAINGIGDGQIAQVRGKLSIQSLFFYCQLFLTLFIYALEKILSRPLFAVVHPFKLPLLTRSFS